MENLSDGSSLSDGLDDRDYELCAGRALQVQGQGRQIMTGRTSADSLERVEGVKNPDAETSALAAAQDRSPVPSPDTPASGKTTGPSTLFRSVAHIGVGNLQADEWFFLPCTLLAAESGYFESKWRGSRSEKPTRKEMLEGVDPEVFEYFANWTQYDQLLHPDTTTEIPFSRFCELYLLGEKLRVPIFKNVIIRCLVKEYLRCGRRIHIDLTNYIYDNTTPGAALRCLWVDFCADTTFTEADVRENLPECSTEFMADLMIRQAELRSIAKTTEGFKLRDVYFELDGKRRFGRSWWPKEEAETVEGWVLKDGAADPEEPEDEYIKASGRGGKRKAAGDGKGAATAKKTRESARVKAAGPEIKKDFRDFY